MANQHFNRLNHDLQTQILSRVDGSTLASAACACSDLRSVAHEEQLWKDLCNSIWPSTSFKETQFLISSIGGYRKFFSDSYPLILNKTVQEEKQNTNPSLVSPSDFVSLIDIYYKDNCTYSKVLHGIPDSNRSWFLEDLFRIDLLNFHDDGNEDDGVADGGDFVPMFLVDKKQRGIQKLCTELEENVRLSWVLVNLKKKKAVNLSSWKPLLVQRNRPSESDLLMCFECVVPAEGILESRLALCVISMKCRVLEREALQCLKLRELSMQVEDLKGARVNGREGLMVIDRALGCGRSRDQGTAGEGYQEFQRERKELRERRRVSQVFAERLCAFWSMVAFACFCFFIIYVIT